MLSNSKPCPTTGPRMGRGNWGNGGLSDKGSEGYKEHGNGKRDAGRCRKNRASFRWEVNSEARRQPEPLLCKDATETAPREKRGEKGLAAVK